MRSGRRREDYLSVYGPLSLLALLAVWGIALVLGFGVLQWAAGLKVGAAGRTGFWEALYYSGTTLVTSLPDARNTLSRIINVVEGGLGISALGLVVGYLPVLYQSYARRELRVFLLDARAGSPPSAGEALIRQGRSAARSEARLGEWEEWIGELLQNQLSYPVLSYFRSQHPNQSWLATLICVLDASALVALSPADEDLKRQAHATFAMGRHALVDLARVFRTEPTPPRNDRLPAADFERLLSMLEDRGTALDPRRIDKAELSRLRAMYEPFANALSSYFLVAMPPWLPAEGTEDNWKATGWKRAERTFAVSDPFRDDV